MKSTHLIGDKILFNAYKQDIFPMLNLLMLPYDSKMYEYEFNRDLRRMIGDGVHTGIITKMEYFEIPIKLMVSCVINDKPTSILISDYHVLWSDHSPKKSQLVDVIGLK